MTNVISIGHVINLSIEYVIPINCFEFVPFSNSRNRIHKLTWLLAADVGYNILFCAKCSVTVTHIRNCICSRTFLHN